MIRKIVIYSYSGVSSKKKEPNFNLQSLQRFNDKILNTMFVSIKFSHKYTIWSKENTYTQIKKQQIWGYSKTGDNLVAKMIQH